MNLAAIFKDSNYKLSQFTPQEIDTLEKSILIKQTKSGDVAYIQCLVRGKEIKLTPEEAVRQLYLQVLTQRYDYPISRITVEYVVTFGREKKKADIAIFDKDRPNVPYIIVELKKPKLKDGKDQLRSYCNATGSPIGVWTNGDAISYYQRKDPNYFEDITDIPNVSQTLADILNERFTLEDLIKKDKLVNEKKSLKSLIEEMEDEVLANAGVDVFEELFKLIFTKLYDEWLSGQGKNRQTRLLEFRNTGQTEIALKNKIQDLFDKAKKHWEGVFSEDSKIALTPSHLSVCVSSLENVKLFNSNLDVVDEAFEYLINQSSKGEKGQYFTPRYVIDMCVKMLHPQEDEYMIDTAAGSSGFPVHTIFHVWKQIIEDEGITISNLFSLEEKPYRCEKYVQEKVFAIDFDEKAVRVARTLNLIAGDGQTNVLHLNTLDFEKWDEVARDEDWQNIYFEGLKRLKKLRRNKDSYKEFQFDLLMANPPFAGDIKESQIISKYDLAKKPNGNWQSKVGRDILFIERNLDFLKPGGRMAIVLPQGRFNNSSDKDIRDYIAERCRILAVVGLHGNTFKPHTGTKTSVLFVQKWNDDPKAGTLCPRVKDYNIFFATMRKSGKDNSGEKICRRVLLSSEEGLSEQEKDKAFLQDNHGHLVVDHDLFNHEGVTEDGIAEAFIEFAKKENLSFFKSSPSVTPFDELKYQRLMDGLEAVEVNFSKVREQDILRLEAEFYIAKTSTFSQFKRGEQIIDCVQYGTSKELNEVQSGYPVLRLNEFESYFIGTPAKYCDLIDESTFIDLRLIAGDVLICRTNGNPKLVGKSALVLENTNFGFASYLFRIRPKKSLITPEVLTVFLNSEYGRKEIEKYSMTGNQTNFSPAKFKEIIIPCFTTYFQHSIDKLVHNSYKLLKLSQYNYRQAEELLLSELNLKDWKPTEENIAVKSFSSSFLASGRFDSDYFLPKYEQAEAVIQNCGFPVSKLGLLIEPIQNGWDFREFTDAGTPYIRVGDIKLGKIDIEGAAKVPITQADIDKPIGLQVGDILFTRKGSFGNSAVVTEKEVRSIISSEIMLLRLKGKSKQEVLPDYVSLFLN
ncbi:N-6 DNA methylase [Cylindrospermum sp. FACHB-282]|uniref:N-6 DNA methylase n=1 Tax=Cylindrospermum sp. FACHB-282 TaxID=2692794 RepID=UPI001F55A1B8|nr:N-6 DNA methylase [Cylindrospermum sp. FACHB-282]